jgi:hypothetical protein
MAKKKKEEIKDFIIPKGEPVKEPLPFALTAEEIRTVAIQAADFSAELIKIKAQMREVSAGYKLRLKNIQGELDQRMLLIAKGIEDREVDCHLVLNKATEKTEFWYEGKILKIRDTTPEDRQKEMPFLRKKTGIDFKVASANDREEL